MAADLWSQFASSARDAWSSASNRISSLAASVTGAEGGKVAVPAGLRSRLDSGLAAWRWSPFGQSSVVPLPPPPLSDPRMALTALVFAKVLLDEAQEHERHFRASSSGAAASSGPPLPVPPVTCTLALAAAWRYFNPVLLREVCLSPFCVVERSEAARLWGCALVHLDAAHLLSNLAVLLPEAAALERQEGSGAFAGDVVALTGLSSALFVAWAVLDKELFHRPNTYYAVGAVGLSSLAFALQVVRGESRRGTLVSALGLPLPAQWGWVAQLALTHVAAPDASFAGHVCGVLAGIAHVYLLRPALRLLFGPPSSNSNTAGGAPRPRFYGSGTTSGRPVGRSQSQGGMGRTLRAALGQLGLVAAAVAVYALASQRRQTQPMSNWRLR